MKQTELETLRSYWRSIGKDYEVNEKDGRIVVTHLPTGETGQYPEDYEILANPNLMDTINPVPEIAVLHKLESVPTESNAVSQNGSRESEEVTEKI